MKAPERRRKMSARKAPISADISMAATMPTTRSDGEMSGQQRGCIGADRQEPAMADRDQPGEPDQCTSTPSAAMT